MWQWYRPTVSLLSSSDLQDSREHLWGVDIVIDVSYYTSVCVGVMRMLGYRSIDLVVCGREADSAVSMRIDGAGDSAACA